MFLLMLMPRTKNKKEVTSVKASLFSLLVRFWGWRFFLVICRIGAKLKEASDQLHFNRNVEDVEVWLAEIEGQLMSEDYGKVCVQEQRV